MNHITELNAENVMRLTAVSYKPTAGVNVIGGNNGQGKSSLLACIAMALGGKSEIPDQPLRKGSDKGKIVAKLDSGLIITRTFTPTGSYLKVANSEGFESKSPQDMLNTLTGATCFDPLAFVREKPAERVKILKRLVGLDTSDIEAKRNAAYAERTEVNKRAVTASHRVAEAPLYNAPAEEVNPADIYAEIQSADAHNQEVSEARNALARCRAAVDDAMKTIADREKRVADIEAMLATARSAVVAAKKVRDDAKLSEAGALTKADSLTAIDTTPLKVKLAQVAEINRYVASNKRRAELEREAKAIEQESADLTSKIATLDAEKADRLSKVEYPLAGLGFSDGDVTFNGLPLAQASSAEQIRVSVAIGAALQPKLRSMIVKDGSLLDDDSLQILADLCKEHDLQLFIERVGKGKECSVIIEDGTVYAGTPDAEGQTFIPGTEEGA